MNSPAILLPRSGSTLNGVLSAMKTWLATCHSIRRTYTKAGLESRGDALLRDAASSRHPISMAVFGFDDLREARLIYDRATYLKIVCRVTSLLHALAGRHGVVAHTGPGEFTVILPGLDRQHAKAAIGRVMGQPARVELDLGGEEILLVPRVELECAGPDVENTSGFYDELRIDLNDSRRSEKHRLNHIARERGRYCRPRNPVAALPMQ